MPSPQEWENIREEFYNLYITRDLTLPHIRAILALQGFNASPKQFKNQITEWRLHKNNKHSDMAFARRKMSQRKLAGKDTVFEIHGQPKSSDDILHYWKRTKIRFESPPVSPRTPPGLSYATPEPMSGIENAESVTYVIEPEAVFGAQRGNSMSIKRPPQAIPTSLTLPDNLHEIEVALWKTERYIARCDMYESATTAAQKQVSEQQTSKFIHHLLTVWECEANNVAPFCAEQARQECLVLAPLVIPSEDRNLLPAIISVFAGSLDWYSEGCSMRSMYWLAGVLAEIGLPEFPLTHIVQSVIQNSRYAMSVFEAITKLTYDCSVKRYGLGGSRTMEASFNLINLYCYAEDWHEAWRLAKTEQQRYLERSQYGLSNYDLLGSIDIMYVLARAQTKLGDHKRAFDTISEAILLCDQLEPDHFFHKIRALCRILTLRGMIFARFDLQTAIDTYKELLDHARGILPLDDQIVLRAAAGLKKCISLLESRTTQVLDASMETED